MFCSNCGNKIDGTGSFCELCGYDLSKKNRVEGNAGTIEPLISVNVSKTQTLMFYDSFLVYKGARIKYAEINGISYLLSRTKHSVNFIPTHTSSVFKIKIDANGQIYDVGSSTISFMHFQNKSQKEQDEVFGKLVYIVDNLIKPFVLINSLIQYGKNNELKIGDTLTVNTKGFYKKRLWRSPEFLSWDEYYNSALHQGYFQIYKSDAIKKYTLFFSCSMSVMNTVVFPELLNIIFQSNGVVSQDEIQQLEERKRNLMLSDAQEANRIEESKVYCWSCSASNLVGQKFCIHCGSKTL